MSKKKSYNIPNQQKYNQNNTPKITSLLDQMEDGREFESLVKQKQVTINPINEIRRALKEISEIRQRPNIAYIANVVNPKIQAVKSIEYSDDLPFSELVNTIPNGQKNIDVLLVTPGGSGTQVAKFVDQLRKRFENVSFILPNIAMSAGTMFALSGEEIVMTQNSYLGPIDPQVPNREGLFYPAQSILTLINEIQVRGEIAIKNNQNPRWTDLQILRQMDPKEIGNAINASKYSTELVANYLLNFKFKNWSTHSNNSSVTQEEKEQRAFQIANQLCNHSVWKSHGRGISREIAWEICRLKITHSESVEGLDRSIKRLWALFYWVFENTPIYKIFVSEFYAILRNDRSLINQK